MFYILILEQKSIVSYQLNPLIITFTGLYEIPRITAFIATAYTTNHPKGIIADPNIYLPPIVNRTIHAIIHVMYFRENVSGALCECAIHNHQTT